MAGGRQRKTPATLLREFRARWTAEKDTWNTFAGIPCQVDGGEVAPGTLSLEYRARWTAGKDTWNAFAEIPCQVDGRKSYLERFCGETVPGGRQEKLPGTLLRGNRARWEAGKATWNAFAEIPCQVDSRERTPATLLREFRGRWTANLSDTGRDSAMKMKIMENLLLFVVNSYFRRAKKWKHANHG